VPVVAFGQGIGPITDPALLAKIRSVLPRVALIGLREGRCGLPLLESLGVPRERIHVTGDDAIELAYRLRPAAPGRAIGINFRIADYVGFGEDAVDALRAPLLESARALNAPFSPAPISLLDSESGARSIGKLLGDETIAARVKIDEPADVIRQIGKSRIMVTTSYHGGVFALAQGIPVVALIASSYYEQKFTGLQDQFPGGCRILDFRRSNAPGELQDAVRDAWESADRVRGSLLTAAARQLELSRALYETARCRIPLAAVGPARAGA